MATEPAPPDPATMSYEAALEELEAIMTRLEAGSISLEESMAVHRRGKALERRCLSILDTFEQELEQISADERTDAPIAPPPDDPG